MSYIYTYKYWTLNNQIGYGGALPPNYDQVVQWLPEPVGLERIDKIGDRDGESFLGVYATGISELQAEDLTGRSIVEFHGTSTYSIVGNSVIIDPLLTFSSLVFDDGTLFSIESLCGSIIVGSQTCTVIGTPNIQESVEYKSWRNLLGYNLGECPVDLIELRVDTATPAQRVFTDLDIDEVDTWAGGVTPAVAQDYDLSGNNKRATQETAVSQPSYNSDGYITFDAVDDGLFIPNIDLGQEFTMECRAMVSASTTGSYLISKYKTDNNGRIIGLRSASGRWGVLYSEDGVVTSALSSIISSSLEAHICVTFNGSLTLYVDGILVASVQNILLHEADVKLALGCINAGDQPGASRGVDILKRPRIYTRALTASEVLSRSNGEEIDRTGLQFEGAI